MQLYYDHIPSLKHFFTIDKNWSLFYSYLNIVDNYFENDPNLHFNYLKNINIGHYNESYFLSVSERVKFIVPIQIVAIIKWEKFVCVKNGLRLF